jgi:hypothetical protein
MEAQGMPLLTPPPTCCYNVHSLRRLQIAIAKVMAAAEGASASVQSAPIRELNKYLEVFGGDAEAVSPDVLPLPSFHDHD